MKHGYLIEMKYISRGQYTEEIKQKEIGNAEVQLRKYAEDEKLKKLAQGYILRRLILVFKGWELVHDSEIDPPES